MITQQKINTFPKHPSSITLQKKQAGAERGQAQVKLEVIVEDR